MRNSAEFSYTKAPKSTHYNVNYCLHRVGVVEAASSSLVCYLAAALAELRNVALGPNTTNPNGLVVFFFLFVFGSGNNPRCMPCIQSLGRSQARYSVAPLLTLRPNGHLSRCPFFISDIYVKKSPGKRGIYISLNLFNQISRFFSVSGSKKCITLPSKVT